MGIKVKNVDTRSALRKYHMTIEVSSCDSKNAILPIAGYLRSVMVGTTAAVVPGLHYVVSNEFKSATLIDVSQTTTTTADGSIKWETANDTLNTAGTIINLNTSSTANYAPVGVVLSFVIAAEVK